MIFVTVGTERFPFDRLLGAVDDMRDELAGEPVFMQTGTSTYTPSCAHERFLSFHDFRERIHEARIIVSHAGAGTLLQCVHAGKVPIMMTRKHSLGEHIDDHQEMLAKRVSQRGLILLAEDAADVREYILRYDELRESAGNRSHAEPALVTEMMRLLSSISSGKTAESHSG